MPRLQIYLMLAALLCVSQATAQQGLPQPHEPCQHDSAGQRVRYLEFSLRYAQQHRQPYWVAYTLEAEELGLPSIPRRSSFLQDPVLKDLTHAHYTNTSYDRGHLSRASYNYRSDQAYKESFYMSNVSPQIGKGFNQGGGAWYRAEDLEEQLARHHRAIHCVSGPVFADHLEPLPITVRGAAGNLTVPGYFFKVILYLSPSQVWQAIGLLLPHREDSSTPVEGFSVPIRRIEELTGLDFNCFLPDTTQQRIETAAWRP